MEGLVIKTVAFGIALPLGARYLLRGKPTQFDSSLAYALANLIGSWVLIQLGLGEALASLNLTQHLILAGIVFASSVITIEMLERFGQI